MLEGEFHLEGNQYRFTYEEGSHRADLFTYDKESGLDIHIIAEETADTPKRWREFQQVFARSIAEQLYNRKPQ